MQLLFHGVGHYVPGRALGPSVWPHRDLITVIEGRFLITVRGRPFTFGEGDALAIPPHHEFHGECLTETGAIWVLHYADFPAREDAPLHETAEPSLIPGGLAGRLDRLLLERFSALWRTTPDSREAELTALLLLTRVEEQALAPAQPAPASLRAAVQVAAKGRINGGVATMARIAGLGPSRFRQVFAQHYGMSPARYLQQLRMEEARRLLGETQRPIKEIAQLVGFTELAAFHRAFRRETGMTPALYRRQSTRVA